MLATLAVCFVGGLQDGLSIERDDPIKFSCYRHTKKAAGLALWASTLNLLCHFKVSTKRIGKLHVAGSSAIGLKDEWRADKNTDTPCARRRHV
jgi:hypothetical protein